MQYTDIYSNVFLFFIDLFKETYGIDHFKETFRALIIEDIEEHLILMFETQNIPENLDEKRNEVIATKLHQLELLKEKLYC